MAALDGKIGGVDKKYVAVGGVLVAGILVIVYFRSKSQAAATASNSTATVTDPAGNVCAALDPNSGYCPGTSQDLAYQQSLTTAAGTDAASYVGGQIIGYDQYGNPIYSSSATQTGVPGGFTNNAQWAQAAQSYLVTNEPSADPSAIGNALGAYIDGSTLTDAQAEIVQQAIAFEGLPPVGGTGGYPPSLRTGGGGTTTGTGGGTTAKPGAVTDINSVETTKGTISVSWRPGTNATSYNLSISPAPNGGSAGTHNIGDRTQYNISGIAKGKTYTIKVTSQNAAGVSSAATKSVKGT